MFVSERQLHHLSLKVVFFFNEDEYKKICHHHCNQESYDRRAMVPTVPKDSIRLREKFENIFNKKRRVQSERMLILLLDRSGTKRVFPTKARSKIINYIQKKANNFGYRFEVVDFRNMNFSEQYRTVRSASIAIGIHGANLVNTMFMPPLSALIEIFPFGFDQKHEPMYRNGGNSGLKYFFYAVRNGTNFADLKRFPSVTECIRRNISCLRHYRDSTLKVDDADIFSIDQILRRAIDWTKKITVD